MIISIICSLIGGGLALCGVIITEMFRRKDDKSKWIREGRADLYYELIGQLESIEIALIADPDDPDLLNYNIDIDVIKEKIDLLADYLGCNAGKIFVFVPKKTYSDLMHFRAELFACSQIKTIKLNDIKDSEYWKMVVHAKNIANNLKNELLK